MLWRQLPVTTLCLLLLAIRVMSCRMLLHWLRATASRAVAPPGSTSLRNAVHAYTTFVLASLLAPLCCVWQVNRCRGAGVFRSLSVRSVREVLSGPGWCFGPPVGRGTHASLRFDPVFG